MSKSYGALFCCVVAVLALASCHPESLYSSSNFRFKEGDDSSWRNKKQLVTDWLATEDSIRTDVYWARLEVTLPDTIDLGRHLGMNINAFGAFEAYWDGYLIGRNGVVRQKGSSEQPGTESSYFLIPDSLAGKGSHSLALRVSQSFQRAHQRGISIWMADYFVMVRAPLITTSFMYILAGAFLIASIFYFFLYINNPKSKPILLFSLICFVFFLLLFIEYAKFFIQIPYTHFYSRLAIIGGLTYMVSFLVPFYFATQFSFKHKKRLAAAILLCATVVYLIDYDHYDLTARRLTVLMWASSLIIACLASRQKAKGGLIVTLGLLLCAFIHYFFIYDISLFAGFSLIVLCMMYLLAIKSKETEKNYASSLLVSARLKTELLKKNIQPHFIKNTLTSLIDWVEESPKDGVAFIQALAGEFELLNAMADATLIPISQEIELCKHHLKVMQFRKEIVYQWEESCIPLDDCIPPAILHTVVENGITHSLPLEDGAIRFKLNFRKTDQYKLYELWTIARNRNMDREQKRGTGFQYIEARLSESYGSAWKFRSERVKEGWLTTIKIFTT